MSDFIPFPKIARFSREIFITEKIDGTNAQVFIAGDTILAGSRSRWLTTKDDNFGFAAWVEKNKEELMKLGDGRHYGEWWGLGIQRGYGIGERRFSLFNAGMWNEENKPACCHVAPLLYSGTMDSSAVNGQIKLLEQFGSVAANGFLNPEGVIIYHVAANQYFKKTILKDEEHKGKK